VRQIGHCQQEGGQLRLNGIQPGGRGFEFDFGSAYLGHNGVRFGVLALGFEASDLFGQRVALGLQLFGAHLQGFALGFKRGEGGQVQVGLGAFAGVQAGLDLGQVFAEKGDVQHGV
jgi:hypothetical protein